jgi:HSP20 family protein
MRAAGVAKAKTPALRLTATNPSQLEGEGQRLQFAIACRAYELFDLRGGEHGHDWEDWFRAESELLRPISVAISESDQRVSVRVNVIGFEAGELKVSVEPTQVTIFGAKVQPGPSAEPPSPNHAHRVIELPAEVNLDAAAIVFEAGVIKLELFKTVGSTVENSSKPA